MIMDLGYTYHCRVFVKSFLGPLDIPGEFEQVDDHHFRGKLKVLGKWLAYATARGKKNMPVEGGFLKRVSHADGHEEPFHWSGIERFR